MNIGDKLRDNDPRMFGRIIEIIEIWADHIVYEQNGRRLKIRLDRIFTDGKPRRSGFSLL